MYYIYIYIFSSNLIHCFLFVIQMCKVRVAVLTVCAIVFLFFRKTGC